MLRIYLLVFVSLLSGCEFSDGKPPVVAPPADSPNPEWQMPAGDHALMIHGRLELLRFQLVGFRGLRSKLNWPIVES